MSKNVAIVLGVSAGAALIGGISLKFLKGRKANVEETPKSLKVLLQEAVAVKKYNEFKDELDIASLHVVPQSKASEPVVEAPTPVQSPVVEDREVLHLVKDEPKTAVSVSRMRAVVTPVFWSHFASNIRRLEVIELTEEAFSDRSQLDYTRGWHKCTLNGLEGILHVTKQHISAVMFDGQDFHGISTSPARFGSRNLTNLTHERVKAYLQGH
ncbi:hypothetical protein D9M68_18410 [compost metagenome]